MNAAAKRFASRWEVPAECALQVRDELLIGLRHEWRAELTMADLGTACWSPITLGMLLLRSTGVDMTPLPDDVQSIIRSNSPQHRVELRGSNESLPRGVVCFDGRCMYLGCCDNLGLARGRARRSAAFEGKDRGKARVRFEVPVRWQGVGILPVKRPGGVGWHFPETGTWETWADLQEVRMAQKAGWEVEVLDCLLWEAGGPLDEWAKRLERRYLSYKTLSSPISEYIASCIRAIALHAIGAMHAPYRQREVVEVMPDSPLATIENVVGVTGGGVTVERWNEKAREIDCYHPEWTTSIWSRARCKVLRALQAFPAEAILGVRGDAIYLDGRFLVKGGGVPFPDDGACGRLRLAWADFNPRPRVRAWDDLLPAGVN